VSERSTITRRAITVKITTLASLTAAAALALTGCAANEGTSTSSSSAAASKGAAITLAAKGSSAQSAAMQKWIADYQAKNAGVTINYSPDGSGAGRDGFGSGAVAFAGSDRAYTPAELTSLAFTRCATGTKALDLPVYISPIAVIFKVDGVTDLKLDADTLAGIFSGKITKWNDAAIVALNPTATLPAANITAVHRSDDSGTTTNFTDYLAQAAPSVWTQKAAGLWPASFAGEAAKGTSGVVDAVKSGQNTIGYADESQAGALGKASLKVGTEFLAPTADAAAKIVDASPVESGRAAGDLALTLDRKAAGVYPAVLVSYALACQTYAKADEGAAVKGFLTYVTSAEGQASAKAAAGSAPLSAAMQAKVKAALDSIK
jgi:phosphate transport system substrate-binding protein